MKAKSSRLIRFLSYRKSQIWTFWATVIPLVLVKIFLEILTGLEFFACVKSSSTMYLDLSGISSYIEKNHSSATPWLWAGINSHLINRFLPKQYSFWCISSSLPSRNNSNFGLFHFSISRRLKEKIGYFVNGRKLLGSFFCWICNITPWVMRQVSWVSTSTLRHYQRLKGTSNILGDKWQLTILVVGKIKWCNAIITPIFFQNLANKYILLITRIFPHASPKGAHVSQSDDRTYPCAVVFTSPLTSRLCSQLQELQELPTSPLRMWSSSKKSISFYLPGLLDRELNPDPGGTSLMFYYWAIHTYEKKV